jgi:hypothetical protein
MDLGGPAGRATEKLFLVKESHVLQTVDLLILLSPDNFDLVKLIQQLCDEVNRVAKTLRIAQ